MFGSLDPAKILVILIIALVVLGPERLPKAARQLAHAWKELTRIREQVTEEVRSAMPDLGLKDLDLPHFPKSPAAAVSGFVRDLTASPTAHVEVEPGGTEDGADLVGAEDFEHSSAVAPETPWFERAVSGGPTRYRSAQILEPGSVAPDGGVLVVAEPSRGELAVIFDDPAMN